MDNRKPVTILLHLMQIYGRFRPCYTTNKEITRKYEKIFFGEFQISMDMYVLYIFDSDLVWRMQLMIIKG